MEHIKLYLKTGLSILSLCPLFAVVMISGCATLTDHDPDSTVEVHARDHALEQEPDMDDLGTVIGKTEPEESPQEPEQLREDTGYDQGSAYYYYMKSEVHKSRGELQDALDTLNQALYIDPDSIYLKKKIVFFHLNRKENDKAMAMAEQICEQHPDDTSALLLLAKLKQQQNQIDDARELYQKILQRGMATRDVYIILGNIYMENGNLDDAFRVFTRFKEHFPDDYAAYFFLGRIHAEKKNYVYAKKAFRRCLELKKDLVEPRFELIDVYKALHGQGRGNWYKNRSRIISLYQEILKIEKHNVRAAFELPLFLYKNGRKNKASSMFSALVDRNRKNPTITMVMAKELISQEKYEDAAIIFTRMLKKDPENSNLHYLAALAFDSLNQNQKAIDHFLKVSPDSEKYKKSIIHAAFLYTEMDQEDTALAFLEKKHEEIPRDIDIISYLAAMYEDKGMMEDALRLLRRGLDYSPDNTEILFRSGIVLDKLDKKSACIQTMKKVIALDPKHAGALNYLGYTYAEMGENLNEAEEMVIKALELKPDDGFITDSLGWIYYKKEMYEKAVELLEKASDLSSGDPLIVEHLGDAYKALKMFSQAIEAYKKALSSNRNPENKPLLEEKINELEIILDREKQ